MLAKVRFSLNSKRLYDYQTELEDLRKNDCVIVETKDGENIAFFDRYILESELGYDGRLSSIIEKVNLYDKESLNRIRQIKRWCKITSPF